MSAGQAASGAGTWRELGGSGVAPLKAMPKANTVGLCERSLHGAAHPLAGDARSRQADTAPGGIRWEAYAAKCAGVLL